MPHDDLVSVTDIVVACRRVRDFTRGVSQEQFNNDSEKQSAVLYQIAVMGEATRRLSPTFIDANSRVPWADIAAMRNRLIHKYDDIDLELVWDTATVHVAELLRVLEPLLPRESRE